MSTLGQTIYGPANVCSASVPWPSPTYSTGVRGKGSGLKLIKARNVPPMEVLLRLLGLREVWLFMAYADFREACNIVKDIMFWSQKTFNIGNVTVAPSGKFNIVLIQ